MTHTRSDLEGSCGPPSCQNPQADRPALAGRAAGPALAGLAAGPALGGSRRPCSRPSNLWQYSVALVLYCFNTDHCAMYCVLYVFLFIYYNTVFFISEPC